MHIDNNSTHDREFYHSVNYKSYNEAAFHRNYYEKPFLVLVTLVSSWNYTCMS